MYIPDTIQSIVAIHLYVTSKSYFNPLSKATFSKVYWNRVSPAFTWKNSSFSASGHCKASTRSLSSWTPTLRIFSTMCTSLGFSSLRTFSKLCPLRGRIEEGGDRGGGDGVIASASMRESFSLGGYNVWFISTIILLLIDTYGGVSRALWRNLWWQFPWICCWGTLCFLRLGSFKFLLTQTVADVRAQRPMLFIKPQDGIPCTCLMHTNLSIPAILAKIYLLYQLSCPET